MTSTYSWSGSFGSIVRYKSIEYSTYKYRGSNFRSKPTPIDGPVHKSDLNYSYSRIHFIRLPQAVARKLICSLSQKVSYPFKIIDRVINGFSTNDISNHFHIYDHLIVKFGTRKKCLGFEKIPRLTV